MNPSVILETIEATVVRNENEWHHPKDGHRSHLGGSVIGRPCSRQLWYGFYWCKVEMFEGRMQRLFLRGQNEESIFVDLLKSIGCEVWFEDSAGKQFRCTDCHGHFGGSLDGVAKHIPTFPANEPALTEMKTHNDKSFKQLLKQGLVKAKHEHFIQTQVYLYKFRLKQALYMAVNKNTDELWLDPIMCVPEIGQQFIERANSIIFSSTAPAKISQKSSYYICTWCSFRQICHYNELPEQNCRTCKFSRPVENGKWACSAYHDMEIDKELMKTGCQQHHYRECLKK